MTGLAWHGHTWDLSVPGPTAARHLAALSTRRGMEATAPMLAILHLMLGQTQLDALEDGVADGRYPPDAFSDLLSAGVEHLSGRPLRAVIALSGSAVSQWSIIRGRLVRDGIADPLRELPTLWALLDAVEWMILESKKDEKETDAYWRSVYGPERGWSDDDETASADAFMDAFG